jgi:Beta-lactamase
MNKQASAAAFVVLLISLSSAVLLAPAAQPAGGDLWPTKGWDTASPASVGLNEQSLSALDKDLAGGKFLLMDSFVVIRCGKKVYERTYAHDYVKIYGKQAREKGALNQRQTGLYNYFDPYLHPYYHGTDMHSMQSVTKTVTSVIIGVAKTRGDFKAGLDTPVLKYFDVSKVKNVDERKRRMTLHDLMTMTSGLDWDEDVPDNDPRNDMSRMEGTDDWVQYTIDRPMAAEPGKVGKAVANAMTGAGDLVFHPLAAYVYKDSHQMLTVTGIVLAKNDVQYFLTKTGLNNYEFATNNWHDLIRINVPYLSPREKFYLDSLMFKQTQKSDRSKLKKSAKLRITLASTDEASRKSAETYMRFYRHYPHYHRVQY